MRHRNLPLGLVLAVTLQACLSPVDITTAYEEEVYLCDDAELYAERVAACRAINDGGGHCSGVLSFEGTIDAVDVVVDTELTQVDTTTLRLPDLSLQRNDINLFGDSPYFSFRMLMSGVGGPDTRADGPVSVDFAPSPDCEDGSEDGIVRFSLRIIAGGGSQEADLTTGSLTITRQTPEEHIGTFEGTYRNGEPLHGCFTVFSDSAVITELDPCE